MRKVSLMMKDKLSSIVSSLTGLSGAASSYNTCHSICLAAIAMLSVIGITVSGLPLMFLQAWAPYLWTVGLVFLLFTVYLYMNKKCISQKLLTANTGFLVIGFPFYQDILLWIIGAPIVASALLWHHAEGGFRWKKKI